MVIWMFAAALAGAAAMYDIRDVCVDESGTYVSLAPSGVAIPLAPLGEAGWEVCNHRDILKVHFDSDAEGSFFVVEGTVENCDTAWHIRSPRAPVNVRGTECVLTFRLETNKRICSKGLDETDKQWRSGLFWYGADGRRCAFSPVGFEISGDTTVFLRVQMPLTAEACEVQIGFDAPDVHPGHMIVIRDVSLFVCTNSAIAPIGSFVSEVKHGGRVSWCAETPPGTSLRFQYAAANDSVDALVAPFQGPDGSAESFFEVPFIAEGEWIRYKAFLSSSDGTASPQLKSVMVGMDEDRSWRPFKDVLPPYVTMASGAHATNAHSSVEIAVTDRSAVRHDTFRATVDGEIETNRLVRVDNHHVVVAPSEGWTNGLHTVDVYVMDCHGNEAESRRYFHVGETTKTSRTSLRDDGTVLINGEPFFPIGIYSVCEREFNSNDIYRAFADIKGGGFNFAHTYGPITDDFLAAANRYDVRLWCAVRPSDTSNFVEKLRNHPAVLAWYLGDDTSDNTTPDELLSRESFIKALDPTRITCQADIASRYADYVIGTDVFMPELYPVLGDDGDKTDSTCVAKVVHDMKSVAADISDGGVDRPHGIWAIIQYFKGWKDWGHFPTKKQLVAMTWASVVHGAHGVVWYTYGGFPDKKNGLGNQGVTSTPERWRNVCELAMHLKELSPILVERTPQAQPKVTIVSGMKTDPFGHPAVTCLLKRHEGKATIIAVNSAPAPIMARIGAFGTGCANVLWESRTVPLRLGELEDSFDPFAVHVYQFFEKGMQQ